MVDNVGDFLFNDGEKFLFFIQGFRYISCNFRDGRVGFLEGENQGSVMALLFTIKTGGGSTSVALFII